MSRHRPPGFTLVELLVVIAIIGGARGAAVARRAIGPRSGPPDERTNNIRQFGLAARVLQVTLRPDVGPDEDYTSKIGECDREGKFTITDVAPGNYKVGIEQFDPTPQVDKLNGVFHPSSSKIKRTIDGQAPLAIDLAKPEV